MAAQLHAAVDTRQLKEVNLSPVDDILGIHLARFSNISSRHLESFKKF